MSGCVFSGISTKPLLPTPLGNSLDLSKSIIKVGFFLNTDN